jgi:DNA processing protein
VFAVPGEITAALSAGTNDLLRQGAAPMLSPGDVLAAIGLEPQVVPRAGVSEAAGALLNLLADGSCAADELARRSGLPSGVVAAALVELELAGVVRGGEGIYRVSPGTTPDLRQPA